MQLHRLLSFERAGRACCRLRAVACFEMISRTPTLSEEARFQILRLLEADPTLSQRDLARAVGISVGTVNYALRALVDKGFVKVGRFSRSRDKRRYAYILTPDGLSAKAMMTQRFLAKKLVEYEALQAEIEALRVEFEEAQGIQYAASLASGRGHDGR